MLSLVATLLTVLFVALKLTHVIAWSWIFVLAPIYVVPIIWIIIVTILFAFVTKD